MQRANDEPAIVTMGRGLIDEYPIKQLREALVRAFRDQHADFIVLDSNWHGQKFQAASVAWGIDNWLLYNDRNQDDTQDIVSSFRLTDKGRRVLVTGEEGLENCLRATQP